MRYTVLETDEAIGHAELPDPEDGLAVADLGPFCLIIILDTNSWFPPSDSPQQKALAYVAARSVGGPLDPALRVTL